jgi:hypothetical protein
VQGKLGEAFDRALQLVKDSSSFKKKRHRKHHHRNSGSSSTSSSSSSSSTTTATTTTAAATAAADSAESPQQQASDSTIASTTALSWPYCAEALEHVWFDFHQECKGPGGWANLDKLLVEVDDAVHQHGYLRIDAAGTVQSVQTGVVRTNCMDCLDRTNVVSTTLSAASDSSYHSVSSSVHQVSVCSYCAQPPYMRSVDSTLDIMHVAGSCVYACL